MGAEGWAFSQSPGCIPDSANGFDHLHQAYTAARPGYTGRVTVPVLWDTRRGTIVNNGVYCAGFATSQTAYEEAFEALFAALDWLEDRLRDRRYLVGEAITEADWRLFTTLVRFDAVYVGHFKCNRRRLVDYPSLWAYTRDLYQVPGVAETVDLDHIKRHYYTSHAGINPTRIVPKGPEVDFSARHGRAVVGRT